MHGEGTTIDQARLWLSPGRIDRAVAGNQPMTKIDVCMQVCGGPISAIPQKPLEVSEDCRQQAV
jgi:hypothetical protein